MTTAPAQGTPIAKSALVDGHEHAIVKRADGTYATSEQRGISAAAHTHGVIVSDGLITVLASAGHSHVANESISTAKSLTAGHVEVRKAIVADPPFEVLSKKLTAFCKANKIEKVWTDGLNQFEATDEGAALKAAARDDDRSYVPADWRDNHEDTSTPEAFNALEKGLTSFCKREGIAQVWTYGLSAFKETPEGKALAEAAES